MATRQAAPTKIRRSGWRRAVRPSWKLLIPVALAATFLAAMVFHSSGSATRPPCRATLDVDLAPSCGALLGVAPESPSLAALARADDALGRRFDLVYSFHDINDQIPSPYDTAVVQRGQMLHIDIDARDYSSPDPYTVKWAAVAAGAYDQDLIEQARGIAGLHVPVFVTFDHEADQPSRSAVGTPADYVAAWRHVHQLFVDQGATNAVWVWVMLGWPPSFPTALQMWPGNAYVDWISWDVYNASGCRSGETDPSQMQSFGQVALPFLTWIEKFGPAAGIDVRKPMMISEAGTVSYPSEPDAARTWLQGMTQALREHPQIKAVTLWDHLGSDPACDYRLSDEPSGVSALAALFGDEWVDPIAPSAGSASASAG